MLRRHRVPLFREPSGKRRSAPDGCAVQAAGQGRPDRRRCRGTLYVLYNDVAWQLLPLELGFGSGRTCWRRLERWQQAGVFDQLHRILLAELNAVGELDWSRACVDGSYIRAKKVGPTPGRRRSTGGKRAANTT
ncbi:transposase [Streptomyces griseiscabiei]|uniref:transposase n=1 Tax=Streptomyces griseiscabiei TaxID=2993540 RepID=UPI000A39A4EE